jgi:hypothetical protein
MYMAIGTFAGPPHPKYGREAALEFATLDEALQKIRDWAEADELETDPDSPMFSRYVLVTPKSASGLRKLQSHKDANGEPFQLRLAE